MDAVENNDHGRGNEARKILPDFFVQDLLYSSLMALTTWLRLEGAPEKVVDLSEQIYVLCEISAGDFPQVADKDYELAAAVSRIIWDLHNLGIMGSGDRYPIFLNYIGDMSEAVLCKK